MHVHEQRTAAGFHRILEVFPRDLTPELKLNLVDVVPVKLA